MQITVLKQFDSETEAFLAKSDKASFLQSQLWLDFQTKLGRKTFILVAKEDTEIIGTCLIIALKLPLGRTSLYSPHGPIISKKHTAVFERFLKEIQEIATQQKSIFLNIDPIISPKDALETTIQKHAKKAKKNIQPDETIIINITPDEEELLKSFHSKTRYNIRLAKRKGVEVTVSTNPKDIDSFYSIAQTTSSRNSFGIHSKQYYALQLQTLIEHNAGALFLATYKKKVIAANIVVFDGKTGIYLHGASSNEFRNVMAPHLLQWEQILESKKRGCTHYDFWGATSSKDSSHPWFGVTRFKKGFSKEFTKYIGAYTIPLNKQWYLLYSFIKKMK